MNSPAVVRPRLDPRKFRDPRITAKGERRAVVALKRLETLWFNTGTLCNLTCRNCYIESSPTNDRLVYLTAAEVRDYLDEIARDGLPTREIGFTGGEPLMNRELPQMLEDCLSRGFRALVLTNAMKPMMKMKAALLALERAPPRPARHARVDRPLHARPARAGARRAQLGADDRRAGLAGAQRLQPARRRPHVLGAGRGRYPQGLRPRCSPSMRSRSTPSTRCGWCCFPRWTTRSTCRRSPRRAGASFTSRPTR